MQFPFLGQLGIDMLRLSGGTLFALMVRAMKRHGRNRGSYGQRGSGITQANMLKDLLKVYNPSTPDQSLSAEKGNATNFKQGKNLGDVFPINDAVVRKKFNDAVCDRYNSRLKLMDPFVFRSIAAFSTVNGFLKNRSYSRVMQLL